MHLVFLLILSGDLCLQASPLQKEIQRLKKETEQSSNNYWYASGFFGALSLANLVNSQTISELWEASDSGLLSMASQSFNLLVNPPTLILLGLTVCYYALSKAKNNQVEKLGGLLELNQQPKTYEAYNEYPHVEIHLHNKQNPNIETSIQKKTMIIKIT